MWEDAAFIDLFLDGYQQHKRHTLTKGFAKEAISLLQSATLGAADDWKAWMGSGDKHMAVLSAHIAIKELGETAGVMPVGSKSEQQLLEFIEKVTSKVRTLAVGGVFLVPCGWLTGSESFSIIVVVQRTATDELCLAVCNTGPDGLQYHPIKCCVETSSNMLYRLAFALTGVPAHRLHDSAFWFMLLRMQVHTPSPCSLVAS
jgi:hypothetical protein